MPYITEPDHRLAEGIRVPKGGRRVLFLANSFKVGGGNRSLLTLAAGVREAGGTPVIVHPRSGPMLEACRAENFHVEVSPSFQPGWRHPIQTWVNYRRLRQLLRKWNIDLVHANDPSTARAVCLATHFAGIPLVCHVHCELPAEYARWAFRRLASPDAFVFNSAALQSRMGHEFGQTSPDAMQTVIYNAVDTQRFSICPRSAVARPRIGMVAHLVPVKGHVDFLKMAADLTERGVDAEYWLIGEDIHGNGYRQQLEELTRALRLDDRVRFLGPRDDVPELINELDLVVCASHMEAFGISLIEAMACEKPVVATRVGGIPEVVDHGITGLLVPSRAPHELANAVQHLLDQPELCRAMGQAARDRVLRLFSQETLWTRFLDLYERLIEAFDRGNSDEDTAPQRDLSSADRRERALVLGNLQPTAAG